jgi:hypothetical protein
VHDEPLQRCRRRAVPKAAVVAAHPPEGTPRAASPWVCGAGTQGPSSSAPWHMAGRRKQGQGTPRRAAARAGAGAKAHRRRRQTADGPKPASPLSGSTTRPP